MLKNDEQLTHVLQTNATPSETLEHNVTAKPMVLTLVKGKCAAVMSLLRDLSPKDSKLTADKCREKLPAVAEQAGRMQPQDAEELNDVIVEIYEYCLTDPVEEEFWTELSAREVREQRNIRTMLCAEFLEQLCQQYPEFCPLPDSGNGKKQTAARILQALAQKTFEGYLAPDELEDA